LLFLLTSINFPAQEDIHTIYDAHLTYNMMLPLALSEFYWYLLPFVFLRLPDHTYPAKDYTTWVMHFLARSMDDDSLECIIQHYDDLEHPLLTLLLMLAGVAPPTTFPSHHPTQVCVTLLAHGSVIS